MTEAVPGLAVTKVVGKPGLGVTFVNADGGPVTPPLVPTTFNGATSGGTITRTNGNLTVTESSGNSDTGARSTANKTTGKYYMEFTFGVTTANNSCVGILASTATYANLVSNSLDCTTALVSGSMFSSDLLMSGSLGASVAGNVISAAIDLTARKAWFRKNGGLWNGTAGHDPATGALGFTIEAALSFAPAVGFGLFASNNSITGNFGATAFAYAVPSGFTAGWPA